MLSEDMISWLPPLSKLLVLVLFFVLSINVLNFDFKFSPSIFFNIKNDGQCTIKLNGTNIYHFEDKVNAYLTSYRICKNDNIVIQLECSKCLQNINFHFHEISEVQSMIFTFWWNVISSFTRIVLRAMYHHWSWLIYTPENQQLLWDRITVQMLTFNN